MNADPEVAVERDDIVGSSPEYGGVPHCGIYDCMHFEASCRICGRAIYVTATICDRHGDPRTASSRAR
jgi:hypothetical protein